MRRIARAGASTVTELAAVGVAAIVGAFPHAVDDHQTTNARFLVDAGAGWLIPQSATGAHKHLASRLQNMTRSTLLVCAEKAYAMEVSGQDRIRMRCDAACEEAAGMKHAIRHIHFVGIGGAGMSGIAEVLHNLGYAASAARIYADSATLQRLQAWAFAHLCGHDALRTSMAPTPW
jgi:hypothetical protein